VAVEHLTKRFGDRVAFDDVSFEVGYGGRWRGCSTASGSSRARPGHNSQKGKSSVSATLSLTREAPFAFELRRGVFDISVDGSTVGTIGSHKTVEVPLEPGHHTLQIRHGRYSSRNESFDVPDGDVVSFRCHGAVVWPTYVASIIKPDLAISLRPA
jgi:hypothetical protein